MITFSFHDNSPYTLVNASQPGIHFYISPHSFLAYESPFFIFFSSLSIILYFYILLPCIPSCFLSYEGPLCTAEHNCGNFKAHHLSASSECALMFFKILAEVIHLKKLILFKLRGKMQHTWPNEHPLLFSYTLFMCCLFLSLYWQHFKQKTICKESPEGSKCVILTTS